jgi:hypothetical protein
VAVKDRCRAPDLDFATPYAQNPCATKEAIVRSKVFVILGLLFTLAAAASGQTKITGTLSCGKPDAAYSIDVGDRTGHSVSISKFACTWTTPMEYGEVQSKDGYDVAYGDASGAKVRSSGCHVSNLSNGDKIYVRFQGNDTTMDGKPRNHRGYMELHWWYRQVQGHQGQGHLHWQSRFQRQW